MSVSQTPPCPSPCPSLSPSPPPCPSSHTPPPPPHYHPPNPQTGCCTHYYTPLPLSVGTFYPYLISIIIILMKPEKNIKKLGNLLIRQPSAKRKDTASDKRVSSTTITSELRVPRPHPKLELNREMIEAQNLNEEELKAISREASRVMSRKVKDMESKVEEGLVGMLEQECQKLGRELEKERASNFMLSNENIELRKSVEILTKRLSENSRQNNQLISENDNADIKVEQAKGEIQRVKLIMKRREEELTEKITYEVIRVEKVTKELQERTEELRERGNQVSNLRLEVEELTEELEHYRGEGQKLKENSDFKMREFNKLRHEMEVKHKQDLEKKNEKLLRLQMEVQQVEQKLREEQNVRKKLFDKGKELQKQLSKKAESVKELTSELSMNKKRINDLNILKSSNKTILDERISKLGQENQKLKRELEKFKRSSKGAYDEQEVSCKPEMFN